MKKIILSVIVVIILLIIFLTRPNPDYTPTIREVLTPIKKELYSFYKQNKRYPDIKERNTLLKKSGCKIKNNYCYYKGKSFLIESGLSNGYSVILKLKNSDCKTGLFKNGDMKVVSCQNRGTTSWGH